MEPLDTDLDYMIREPRPAKPGARLNWLFIFPSLGVLWLLYLLGAAIFQWPVTGVVDAVMGFMILLFAALIGMLFWALAPKANNP